MHEAHAATQGVRSVADRLLGWGLVALMGIAVLNVLWQVFSRYLLNSPSSYTEELARYLLTWIALLGAAYAVGGRAHLAIDLLPAKLTGVRRCGLALFINLCIFLFALLALVIGGVLLVDGTLESDQTSPAFGVRIGLVYASLPMAGVIMMFYAVLNAIDDVGACRKGVSGQPAES
ncbi:MAG: TRAP transporter small permease [Phycisphaerales bacterium]|nr:TRAP transporter small permease [Phycisphaerales bacterium]